MAYKIFVRNWWKVSQDPNDIYHGDDPKLKELSGLTPDPSARKTYIKTVDTVEEARKFCKEYNALHPPGKLSRKAEFMSIN